MKTSTNPRKGFTLVELLVVITIIVTLMAILIPVVGSAQKKAVALKAKNGCTDLVTSVTGYYNAYNILPANSASAPTQDTEVESTEPIMSILAGMNINNMNRKETPFGNFEDAKGSSRNNAYAGLWQDNNGAALYDPWRKKAGVRRGYMMLIDYDYNTRLNNPFEQGRILPRLVIVWSTGKDGKWSRGKPKVGLNEDNVYSWM